jgi:predicted N-formylglutamate amidohydrolase
LADWPVIITCEHGGRRVPRDYQHLFAGKDKLLASHRGWDRGALPLARAFARALGAPLYYSQTTRLLIDLNRSLHHRSLCSPELDRETKQRVIDEHYLPYRRRVEAAFANAKRVIHLGVHTFTPKLRGQVRQADIGLLYDPSRRRERELCRRWRDAMRLQRVYMNSPYRGIADGLTTAMRRRFPQDRYVGIELEVNQRLIDAMPTAELIRSFRDAIR